MATPYFSPRWLTLALLAIAPVACFATDVAPKLPPDRFHYPVALQLSPAGTQLFVANSNFDLQYTGGTLQVLDAVRLRALVPRVCDADEDCTSTQRCDSSSTPQNGSSPSFFCVDREGPSAGQPCAGLGEQSIGARGLYPGRCAPLDIVTPPDGRGSLVFGAVRIGTFATEIVYRSRPPAADGAERPGARIFVPVRGESTLHWLDVDDDSKASRGPLLECGQGATGGCDDAHRVGNDPSTESVGEQRLPSEPFAIDATADAAYVVVAHQGGGAVSLFTHDWDDARGPRLVSVLRGQPNRVMGVAALPARDAASPSFLIGFRESPELRVLRVHPPLPPTSAFLSEAGRVGIRANASSADSREIAVDADDRLACERACSGAARATCLDGCAAVPVRAYIANRSPASLIVAELRPGTNQSTELPTILDSIPMPVGPARVQLGKVIDLDGKPAKRVFVVSFDQRRVAIVDPLERRVEATVETGRGPQGLALDLGELDAQGVPSHAFAFVAHFVDSYLAVIDLDRRHARHYGRIVLNIGRPIAPRSAK